MSENKKQEQLICPACGIVAIKLYNPPKKSRKVCRNCLRLYKAGKKPKRVVRDWKSAVELAYKQRAQEGTNGHIQQEQNMETDRA